MLTDEELPPLPEFSGAATPVLREALQSIARDYARAVERAAYEAAIKACGCPEGGAVLDPFVRSGTTMVSALRTGRQAVGIELNPEYADFAAKRIRKEFGELAQAKDAEAR